VAYYQSKKAPESYMKTMPLVLLRSGEDISKVIEPSIFHQNSFIHMSSKRTVKLMLSRYDQVTI